MRRLPKATARDSDKRNSFDMNLVIHQAAFDARYERGFPSSPSHGTRASDPEYKAKGRIQPRQLT